MTSEKPLEVEFHRSWNGNQRIIGRLTADGKPFVPSPTLIARAWAPQQMFRAPVVFDPKIHRDGSFELMYDAESVTLFFVDRDHRRSGFVKRAVGDAKLEVSMEPMTATYSGILIDENAQPMSGRTLDMSVKTSDFKVIAAEQTDENGHFLFSSVPCKVPLQFNIRNEGDLPEYFLFDRDRLFNPGEVRENDQLKPRRPESSASNVHPPARWPRASKASAATPGPVECSPWSHSWVMIPRRFPERSINCMMITMSA